MSGNTETLKRFLVTLGFKIDDAGKAKFDRTIKSVTANAIKMGAAVEKAALAVTGSTAKIARGFNQLHWAVARTGSSIASIKALGSAAYQAGKKAQTAHMAFKSLATYMRSHPSGRINSPAAKAPSLDTSGQRKDTSTILPRLGAQLNRLISNRIYVHAQRLSLDDESLQLMRSGKSEFSTEYQRIVQRTGFDAEKAAAQRHTVTQSREGLAIVLRILKEKIEANLANDLATSLDNLNNKILNNFHKIETIITTLAKSILWLSDAFSRMLYRLIQGSVQIKGWWDQLSTGSRKLIVILAGLLSVWKLLNSAFMKSPIGMISTLLLSLGLLYDDYMTWKEGGKSLIDWEQWEPSIQAAIMGIADLCSWITKGITQIEGWEKAFYAFAAYLGGAWLLSVGKTLAALSARLVLPLGKTVATLFASLVLPLGKMVVTLSTRLVTLLGKTVATLSARLAPLLGKMAAGLSVVLAPLKQLNVGKTVATLSARLVPVLGKTVAALAPLAPTIIGGVAYAKYLNNDIENIKASFNASVNYNVKQAKHWLGDTAYNGFGISNPWARQPREPFIVPISDVPSSEAIHDRGELSTGDISQLVDRFDVFSGRLLEWMNSKPLSIANPPTLTVPYQPHWKPSPKHTEIQQQNTYNLYGNTNQELVAEVERSQYNANQRMIQGIK